VDLSEVCGLETEMKLWRGGGREDGGAGAVLRLLKNTVTRFGERPAQLRGTVARSRVWIGAQPANTSFLRGEWCQQHLCLIFSYTGRLDQTTRIHAPIRDLHGLSFWHELGRPQVHGYDILGVAFLGPLKFVSIADEKVARVFEAPRGFVDLAERLGVAVFTEDQAGSVYSFCKYCSQVDLSQHNRPVAASVPPLGLSNKAMNEGTCLYRISIKYRHRGSCCPCWRIRLSIEASV